MSVETELKLKTAIDERAGGRARMGHLFGYEAIARDQTFWFEVLCADGVDESAVSQLGSALTEKPIYLGRSRKAEFGRARISDLDAEYCEACETLLASRRPVDDKNIRILLLSDLALVDLETGQPTTTPSPEQFGLPSEFVLDARRTFLRSRRFAGFNGKRGIFDGDRDVLSPGGVIVFSAPSRYTDQEVQSAANQIVRAADGDGIGIHLAEGLGRIAVDPWSLAAPGFQLSNTASFEKSGRAPRSPAEPQDKLFTWARARTDERRLTVLADRSARSTEPRLMELYREARKEARAEGVRIADIAPSNAQWGSLGHVVSGISSLEKLHKALFTEPPRKSQQGSRLPDEGDEEGFCLSGTRARKWRFQAVRHSETYSFVGLLEDLASAEKLDVSLTEAGLVPSDYLRVRLVILTLQSLAGRMPRALATLERSPGGRGRE